MIFTVSSWSGRCGIISAHFQHFYCLIFDFAPETTHSQQRPAEQIELCASNVRNNNNNNRNNNNNNCNNKDMQTPKVVYRQSLQPTDNQAPSECKLKAAKSPHRRTVASPAQLLGSNGDTADRRKSKIASLDITPRSSRSPSPNASHKTSTPEGNGSYSSDIDMVMDTDNDTLMDDMLSKTTSVYSNGCSKATKAPTGNGKSRGLRKPTTTAKSLTNLRQPAPSSLVTSSSAATKLTKLPVTTSNKMLVMEPSPKGKLLISGVFLLFTVMFQPSIAQERIKNKFVT